MNTAIRVVFGGEYIDQALDGDSGMRCGQGRCNQNAEALDHQEGDRADRRPSLVLPEQERRYNLSVRGTSV